MLSSEQLCIVIIEQIPIGKMYLLSLSGLLKRWVYAAFGKFLILKPQKLITKYKVGDKESDKKIVRHKWAKSQEEEEEVVTLWLGLKGWEGLI